MVCGRCVRAVKQIFQDTGVVPLDIHLGEILLENPLTSTQRELVKTKLSELGFELLDDNRKQLIERIKSIIIEHIHYGEDEKFIFSEI